MTPRPYEPPPEQEFSTLQLLSKMPKKKIIKRKTSRNNPMNLTGEYLNQKIKSKARTLIPTKTKK